VTESLPPPHPPKQAKFPGRRVGGINKHLDAQRQHHEHTMRRPNEPLHLAKHHLGGVPHKPKET
jgi:hypothetical protein